MRVIGVGVVGFGVALIGVARLGVCRVRRCWGVRHCGGYIHVSHRWVNIVLLVIVESLRSKCLSIIFTGFFYDIC